MADYRKVRVEKGSGGWGGPLVIEPTAERNKIVAVTGGGIPPLAQKLAEMTGCEVIDGFRTSVPDEQMAAVVVDCGGTARAGVYPRKRVPTINMTPVGQAGPLAEFIKEDIYVSGVKPDNLHFAEEGEGAGAGASAAADDTVKSVLPKSGNEAGANPFELSGRVSAGQEASGITGIIARMGRAIGRVVGVLFASGRQSVEQVIRNVLPFMAFVAMVIGIINKTGLGNQIANLLEPLGGSLPGLLLLSVICSLPFLSPILGPGAVIAQVVGVLIGNEIAKGNIDPQYALPALFAYDAQVGCDFVPVGLALGEAKPETVEIGVPSVLFSRVITAPAAVVIGFVFSIGMY